MKIAVYPGTFDPVTYGHLDIMNRSRQLFDQVIVAIYDHTSIKKSLFTVAQRQEFIVTAIKSYDNVSSVVFKGLLAEFMATIQAKIVIRGIRSCYDLESERQMAEINHLLNPQLEYVFIPASAKYTHLSSSIVREIASLNGNLNALVPKHIVEAFATPVS